MLEYGDAAVLQSMAATKCLESSYLISFLTSLDIFNYLVTQKDAIIKLSWVWAILFFCCFQVLGYYRRSNGSEEQVEKFINEIKSISSEPVHDHFFNVSDEFALENFADTLGDKVFALEGENRNSHSCIYYPSLQLKSDIHVFG